MMPLQCCSCSWQMTSQLTGTVKRPHDTDTTTSQDTHLEIVKQDVIAPRRSGNTSELGGILPPNQLSLHGMHAGVTACLSFTSGGITRKEQQQP
eukprot:scaffold140_cov210-Skeletonema_marinoi.AAC.8